MPISATGSRAGEGGFTPTGEAGFTLVELVVVMVIIGLASAAVVVTLPDDRSQLRSEAEGFAARLVAARDLAIVSGNDIGVRVTPAGYGFDTRRGEEWQAISDKALAPRGWSAGTVATTAVEGGAALVFDTTGIATPAQVQLGRGDAQVRIAVDAGGAVRIDAR